MSVLWLTVGASPSFGSMPITDDPYAVKPTSALPAPRVSPVASIPVVLAKKVKFYKLSPGPWFSVQTLQIYILNERITLLKIMWFKQELKAINIHLKREINADT